jgi:hypothetical protein
MTKHTEGTPECSKPTTSPKPLSWFVARINKSIYRTWHDGSVVDIPVKNYDTAVMLHKYEAEGLVEYRDQP